MLFVVATLGPYVVVGKNWGMIWFMINQPLSSIVEDTIGIGPKSVGLICAITFANATLWSGVASAIAFTGELLLGNKRRN